MNLHTALPGAQIIFRGDIQDDPVAGFDRGRQLAISARRLEHLRAAWPSEWLGVRNAAAMSRLNSPEQRGVREFRNRISVDIRVADESADFLRTVAFVSRQVVQTLKADTDGAATKLKYSHLDRKRFAHEHGVPGGVVAKILVDEKNSECAIRTVLDALSVRSLLDRDKEAKAIDRVYKSYLPAAIVTSAGAIPVRKIPLRFYGFARYYAVEPELVATGLLATTRRAQRLLDDFLEYLEAPDTSGLAADQALTAERLGIHVPDDVFKN